MPRSGQVGALISKRPDMLDENPSRFLCRISLLKGLTAYTCGQCTWNIRMEHDDPTAAQVAFDAHRCVRFPVFVPGPTRE